MKPRLIARATRHQPIHRHGERGVTMALVAAAMVAIMAMAALSIDAVTLYLANAEAQRTADAAALAAAKVISLSGITGTASPATQTAYWQSICGGSSSLATQTAEAVAAQNQVGGAGATATVNYSTGPGVRNTDCSTFTGNGAFAVNPMVVVKVQNNLPTFFARIWGKSGSSVSATSAAEAFNPSGSATYAASGIVPVQPRCVKPWIVPNYDPLNPQPVSNPGPPPTYCNAGNCATLADLSSGSITNPGISLSGTGSTGVIGETLTLVPDCTPGADCSAQLDNPIIPNRGFGLPKPNLEYLPGQVSQASSAVPSDGTDACNEATSNYAQAIAGCDQTTTYQCGVQNGNTVDLSENPGSSGDTANGVQCLIHQGTLGLGASSGQDTLVVTSYPFQIKAGDNNPLNITGNVITASNSIVTLPIYDVNNPIKKSGTSSVTVVGFMQVFIHGVNGPGDVKVTILNVAGCGNGTNPTGNPVFGASPVPVRLITPP
ncbi:MAG TPA: pilus assembly protein TadG-related protein [Candidatus Sulfotelmatobacter sp.]